MRCIFVGVAFAFFISCNNNAKDIKIVEYTSSGMTGKISVVLSPENINIHRNLEGNSFDTLLSMQGNMWAKLLKLCREIDVEKMNELKASSNSRSIDGAGYGELNITLKNSTYKSGDFDSGNPPSELKELEDFIWDSIYHKVVQK